LNRLLTPPLAEYNNHSASSTRIERMLVMARPADLDAGEISDKGYVNQRNVLACRSALLAMLYAEQVPPGILVAGQMA
jgi:feruloyl-CoA synthase